MNSNNENTNEGEETSLPTTSLETMNVPVVTTATMMTTITLPSEIEVAPIETIDLSTSPSTSTNAAQKMNATDGEASAPTAVRRLESTEPAPSTSSSATASTSTHECPICLQTAIHPARLPCGHIFCFLCVKGVAYKNRRCAMCRREIPPEFLDHPQLVNGIEDLCTTKATDDGYQWFYEGRNGWWQYDDRTSQDIEEAYRKGEKSCTILVAGYVYIVDLEFMLQQRQNEPSRCRRVKRDLATIPKKGVAGLRIEGNTVTTDSNFSAQLQQQARQHQEFLQQHQQVRRSFDDGSVDLELLGIPPARRPRLMDASDFISTIAATDAAIRIASDIIGSTLAHADELSRGAGGGGGGGGNAATQTLNAASHQSTGEHSQSSTTNITPPSMVAHGSRELLGAAEELLDATQSVISEADQQTIDLYEQTLNDFHALTLRNLMDSSNEENDDDDDLDNDGNSERSRGHGRAHVRPREESD